MTLFKNQRNVNVRAPAKYMWKMKGKRNIVYKNNAPFRLCI